MRENDWVPVPVGIDAPRWVSRAGCRNVLVVAHTIVSAHQLVDVVDLLESDPRVQVVFTVAPAAFGYGVAEYVAGLGGLVWPWHQAVHERFDLALAASYGGLHQVHAPLVVMGHGAGTGKLVRPSVGGGPLLPRRPAQGLDEGRLTYDGRVLPSVLVLAHDSQRDILARQCPAALPVALVAGDPCLDRLVASEPLRDRYRHALGVGDGQELVVVSSTWGRQGLFGHAVDLLPRLMTELPAGRFRVAAVIHPAVWAAHGHRQVRSWLRDCQEAGLILLEPEQDWRAMVVAADRVIGDHGSVTAYAAALGRPILRLAPALATLTTPGSAQELVLSRAARLDTTRPLAPQVRSAPPLDGPAVAGMLTSRPGEAHRLLHEMLYRMLALPEPGRHRRATPAPVPGTGAAS